MMTAIASDPRLYPAVLATCRPCWPTDVRAGRPVKTVLLPEGLKKIPEAVPLRKKHRQDGPMSVVGFCTEIHRFYYEVRGFISFLDDNECRRLEGEFSRGDWKLSIGFNSPGRIDIPKGRAETVAGRMFWGPIRVATEWTVKEVSIVTAGADPEAGPRLDSTGCRSLPW